MTVRRVVVVGAGSAGCVAAARLSARRDLDVTVLEAGPDVRSADEPPEIRGPSFLEARVHTDRYWQTSMATRAAGQPARTYERGRGTGGSSAINGMIALPGEPDDYDDWERFHDCQGWSWRDVEPWFHTTQLVLNRAPRREWGALNRALAAAHPEALRGVPLTRNVAGIRVSGSDAYLEPARSRPNLTVRGDARVDRLVLDAGRCVAVRLVDGEEVGADVVVMCAGAIHTPAILLRSGLDVDGIGENLHDHPAFAIGIARAEPAEVGALPIATVAQASTSWARQRDVQLVAMEYLDRSLPEVGMLLVALMRTFSRGTVSLVSDDPLVEPRVEFDMLADERDVVMMQRAIDIAERTVTHRSMLAVGAPLAFDRSEEGVRRDLADYVHAGGSCAMGRVLDPFGRLRGHHEIVVCDASAWPEAPRANTHLPVVMLAERVTAMLLDRLARDAAE